MNEIRRTFLDTTAVAIRLLSAPEIAARWDQPSALEEFRMRGLVGHLVRATTSVEHYLDQDMRAGGELNGEPIEAPQYYSIAVEDPNIKSSLHQAIRQRGEEAAAGAPAATVDRLASCATRLEERLETEPADRLVSVYRGMVLRLDDYLVTRLIELVVHIDDVAVSAGLPTPEVGPAATDTAIAALVDVARHRHGDLAVIRAMTRRERDEHAALRVL
jgi:hypothetical protein